MRRILTSLLVLYCFTARSQSSPSTLDVVSWNLEWFGSTTDGPANDNQQRENAKKIIRYIDADIYGLVEIVDTAQVRRLVDSLGTDYAYIISDFCSNAMAPGGAAWRNGQKLMFLYKKSIFSNVKTRGLLRSSSSAYTNWASGRFPYLLNADATINGITKNINFILLHGKSGATASDYDRRWLGAQELKDTLDAQFPNSLNIIFGDFNDALDRTISSNSGPETSYQAIVSDSTDADHYRSVTLPLAWAGQSTMINYPNVIDNHVISNEVEPFYVLNSAKVRTDVVSIVPDYITAHSTSDHYPVFTNYSLEGLVTGVTAISPELMGIAAYPNPVSGPLYLRTTKTITNLTATLNDINGRRVFATSFSLLGPGSTRMLPIPVLAKGLYLLQLQTAHHSTTIKLLKLQ